MDLAQLRQAYLESGSSADRAALLAILPRGWSPARCALSIALAELETHRHALAAETLTEVDEAELRATSGGAYALARLRVVDRAWPDAVRLFTQAWELAQAEDQPTGERRLVYDDHLAVPKEVAYYLGRIHEQAGQKATAIEWYQACLG